jgi:NADH-quinone oxidoreductase subunit N
VNFIGPHITDTLRWFGPELILIAGIVMFLVIDLLQPLRTIYLTWLSIVIIVLYVIATTGDFITREEGTLVYLWNRHLILNGPAFLFKYIGALGTFLFIANASKSYSLKSTNHKPLFHAMVLTMLFALSIIVMSDHIMAFIIGLELLSLMSYLLCLSAEARSNTESALKYFIFGAFSSALMWYGASLLYGLSGSLTLHDWQAYLLDHHADVMILPAVLLFFAGLWFKLSVFPFHFWVPDVYEGLPAPLAGFISAIPKVAVIWFFWKIFPYNTPGNPGWEICAVLFGLTLAAGNFPALLQRDAQRMMAYSSVAHAGFILLPFLIPGKDPSIFVFYLVVYVVMTNALFFTLDQLEYCAGSSQIKDFKGIGIAFPWLGIMVFILMVSLTGLPPTAGFYAKFFVLTGVWEAYQQTGVWFYVVIVLWGVINTLVSLYYYLRIPFFAFFKRKENAIKLTSPDRLSLILLTLYIVPLLVFFLKPEWILNVIRYLMKS